MGFIDSLDIANRALQHCGQPQILSVTEDTKANTEASFAYDKLRRAELRRNIWRFSTRRACLRPVDTSTMILQPSLYQATLNYNPGAIVKDVNSNIWISIIENNQGNSPGGNNEAWDAYFGPMTIEPWNQAITAGPQPWSPTTYYAAGDEVTGSDGNVYLSVTNSNFNNNPVMNGGVVWTNTGIQNPYNPLIGYWAGELVYVQSPNSPSASPLYQIYMSLANNNTDTPNIPTPYNSTVIYNGSQIVSYSSRQWSSNLELNLGNTPGAYTAALYSLMTTYASGATIAASNGFIYTSVGNGNLGNDPTFDLAGAYWTNTGNLFAWTELPTYAPTNDYLWLPITATIRSLKFQYPIGSGPSSESETRNVFRLPGNYLNVAPQDPKAGSTSYLGAPSGIMYEDWELEGNYICSSDTGPIMFRFIADICKVRDMDDMFCEGLACKIATGICPSLTQSSEKLKDIASEYKMVMGDARVANAIETGPVEPPEDDFITCRM